MELKDKLKEARIEVHKKIVQGIATLDIPEEYKYGLSAEIGIDLLMQHLVVSANREEMKEYMLDIIQGIDLESLSEVADAADIQQSVH